VAVSVLHVKKLYRKLNSHFVGEYCKFWVSCEAITVGSSFGQYCSIITALLDSYMEYYISASHPPDTCINKQKSKIFSSYLTVFFHENIVFFISIDHTPSFYIFYIRKSHQLPSITLLVYRYDNKNFKEKKPSYTNNDISRNFYFNN
jgi:hypothetical protein